MLRVKCNQTLDNAVLHVLIVEALCSRGQDTNDAFSPSGN